MLCLADRGFFSYDAWKRAQGTGADLAWRVKKSMKLPCLKRFHDGSYLSKIYPTEKDRRQDRSGVWVRVVEYRREGVANGESLYRMGTTILDPDRAPAEELAALYHERWEIETSLDEFKTHLRGRQIILRSKTPDLVRQEFYGLMLAHFAIRRLMHEAALKADEDPDHLSFTHTVNVVRRKLPIFVAISPSGKARFS
jgi:IS4 transposase